VRYLGGKSRLGGRIVQAILDDLGVKRLSLAVDLCSGAGGVTHCLADVCDSVVAVDAHPGMVALHKAVQCGYVPPCIVSEEEYRASFALDWSDPLAAFIGFGCAFGGIWRQGYARNAKGRNFAGESSRALCRDARANVEHVNADALVYAVSGSTEVVYCDPPYEGTVGYVTPAAARGAWWKRLAALANPERACYLSEYAEAPPAGVDARLVWSASVNKRLLGGVQTERLWRVLGASQGGQTTHVSGAISAAGPTT